MRDIPLSRDMSGVREYKYSPLIKEAVYSEDSYTITYWVSRNTRETKKCWSVDHARYIIGTLKINHTLTLIKNGKQENL